MIGQLERIVELKNLNKSLHQNHKGNLIAFTSGKGGVGKTVLSLNLAYMLSKQGKKILFADFDFNFANAHIMLNIIPQKTIKNYLDGKILFKNIITRIDNNFHLLPGSSGSLEMNGHSNLKITSLLVELKKISVNYDYVFIDNGQLNDFHQLEIILGSDRVMIVTSPEPTAVMDAYVIVKMLKQNENNLKKHVIVNKCSGDDEADITFENLNNAVKHFLKEELELIGFVYFDQAVHKSITSQKLFSREGSNSPAYHQISKISGTLAEFVQVANINHSPESSSQKTAFSKRV
jgi:flagellar biosynthesis protein FlhG